MMKRDPLFASPRLKDGAAGYLAFLFFILCSCTEEVVLEGAIKEGAGPVVVEARIEKGENALVVLARPATPESPESFPQVTDARVVLSDDAGREEELLHLGHGHYRAFEMQGRPGGRYSLSVVAGDEKITGHSSMPVMPLTIDSAAHRLSEHEYGFLRSQAIVYFKDPPGQADFIWARATIQAGGAVYKYYFFYEDGTEDGRLREWAMPVFQRLLPGQLMRIEAFQVEEEVFNFFKGILEQVSPDKDETDVFLAPPGNLSANLDGRSPGYFAASIRTEIVLGP